MDSPATITAPPEPDLAAALREGEARIQQIRGRLRAEGRMV